jgi:hypothetical protein
MTARDRKVTNLKILSLVVIFLSRLSFCVSLCLSILFLSQISFVLSCPVSSSIANQACFALSFDLVIFDWMNCQINFNDYLLSSPERNSENSNNISLNSVRGKTVVFFEISNRFYYTFNKALLSRYFVLF